MLICPEGRTLELGGTYVLPVRFLWPELVRGQIFDGNDMELCEANRVVAEGKVLKLRL